MSLTGRKIPGRRAAELCAEHGEWFGHLNDDGSPGWTAKANGWKGCFHLPRVLLRCYRLPR